MSDRSPRRRPEDALIEAVLEARGAPGVRMYCFGNFRVDLADQRITRRDGVTLAVPPKEFETLCCLLEARGRLVTKRELLARVWAGVHVDEGTIAHRISALRKVLGRDEEGKDYIETVPRVGYRLTVPVSAQSATG
jgi:DNA-binding winged helix-turn-helix (wHTH) protein